VSDGQTSERVCCLLVLDLVSSTPPCIRQPGPRVRVLGVCGRLTVSMHSGVHRGF